MLVDEELAIVMNEEADSEACRLSFFSFFSSRVAHCGGYETHGLAGHGAVFGGNSSGGKGTRKQHETLPRDEQKWVAWLGRSG